MDCRGVAWFLGRIIDARNTFQSRKRVAAIRFQLVNLIGWQKKQVNIIIFILPLPRSNRVESNFGSSFVVVPKSPL